MDSNAFALFVLGYGTVILAIVVWQVFVIARTRLSLSSSGERNEGGEPRSNEVRQLDARLTALADDVHAIEQRVAQLAPEPQRNPRTGP